MSDTEEPNGYYNTETMTNMLGDDITGSTITRVAIYNHNSGQVVGRYDDGRFLMVEYTTKDGAKKVFSIVGPRIADYEKPSPLNYCFVLNDTDTKKAIFEIDSDDSDE